MTRHTVALAAVAVVLTAGHAAGQGRDFSKVDIEAESLAPGVHMLTGAGGNIGLSVGEDATFIIDDQFAPLTEKIAGGQEPGRRPGGAADEGLRRPVGERLHEGGPVRRAGVREPVEEVGRVPRSGPGK